MVKKLMVKNGFHGCPVIQNGSNRKEIGAKRNGCGHI
jgi:hypothetical protein